MNSAGLGLAVVKHLLNRCGGTIQVSSKPEKGTTVLLTLPVNEK
jgi:signal transduction histidine kinase